MYSYIFLQSRIFMSQSRHKRFIHVNGKNIHRVSPQFTELHIILRIQLSWTVCRISKETCTVFLVQILHIVNNKILHLMQYTKYLRFVPLRSIVGVKSTDSPATSAMFIFVSARVVPGCNSVSSDPTEWF